MPNESAFALARRAKQQSGGADLAIAVLAERQHGLVTRQQLLGLGLSPAAVGRRLKAGRLHRLRRGVYAVGHRLLSQEGRWMNAVLAGGAGAVLSHRSAAALWGLQRPAGAVVEITTPRSARSKGELKRHTSTLPADEVATRRRIPVTTVSRTLLDLAGTIPIGALERALREVEVRRLPLHPPLQELFARYPRRAGTGALTTCLDRLERLSSRPTRSELEARFLAFLAGSDLPRPETGVVLRLEGGTVEADCLWRGPRLIVELDGHRVHGTRSAFESDRERDRQAQAAGWTVVRITWRQLRDEPEALARDLRRLVDV